jgi:hypothetical protein
MQFWKIQYNHLRLHDPGLTLREYRRMFPGVPTVSPTLSAYVRDQRIDQLGRDPRWCTRETIIAEFKRETALRGRQPAAGEWLRRKSAPDVSFIQRLFGSWNALVEAAGGTPRGVGGQGRKRRNRCDRGHQIVERGGYRFCLICARDRQRRWTKDRDRPGTGEWRVCSICGGDYYVPRYLVLQGYGKGCNISHSQLVAAIERAASRMAA